MKNLFKPKIVRRPFFEAKKEFPGVLWSNDKYLIEVRVRTVKDALVEIGYCIALWLALIVYVPISIFNVFWLLMPRVYKVEEGSDETN